MTKGKIPANNNFYDRYFFSQDPHRTLVDQIDAGKYIVGRARASARETDFLWQIWTLEFIGTEPQITYASDGEPRFRWVDRELVTDPTLPDDGSPAGIYIANPRVDAGDPAGTTVGFLFPMAKDVGMESYVFQIIDDPSDKFELSPTENNRLLLSDTADGADDEYQLEVRVIDSQGRFFSQVITVDVVNIRLSSTTVPEESFIGTKIADIVAINANEPVTFAIIDDPDSKFAISGSDLITDDIFDFTVAESHSVTIQYTDALAVQRQETFEIAVDAENQSLLASIITEDLHGDSAVRVIPAERKNVTLYNEVNSVGLGDSVILTHTVPLNRWNHLLTITASGDNIGIYRVVVNGSVVWKARSYYTNFNIPITSLEEYPLEQGDVVQVIVENRTNEAAAFNATLVYREHDV